MLERMNDGEKEPFDRRFDGPEWVPGTMGGGLRVGSRPGMFGLPFTTGVPTLDRSSRVLSWPAIPSWQFSSAAAEAFDSSRSGTP